MWIIIHFCLLYSEDSEKMKRDEGTQRPSSSLNLFFNNQAHRTYLGIKELLSVTYSNIVLTENLGGLIAQNCYVLCCFI